MIFKIGAKVRAKKGKHQSTGSSAYDVEPNKTYIVTGFQLGRSIDLKGFSRAGFSADRFELVNESFLAIQPKNKPELDDEKTTR